MITPILFFYIPPTLNPTTVLLLNHCPAAATPYFCNFVPFAQLVLPRLAVCLSFSCAFVCANSCHVSLYTCLCSSRLHCAHLPSCSLSVSVSVWPSRINKFNSPLINFLCKLGAFLLCIKLICHWWLLCCWVLWCYCMKKVGYFFWFDVWKLFVKLQILSLLWCFCMKLNCCSAVWKELDCGLCWVDGCFVVNNSFGSDAAFCKMLVWLVCTCYYMRNDGFVDMHMLLYDHVCCYSRWTATVICHLKIDRIGHCTWI